MPNEFNANDIFEIAIKIEENGTLFYKNAAAKSEDEKSKNFLLELAKMEESHVKTFTELKNRLNDEEKLITTFDIEDENSLYLKALADTRVFLKKDEPDIISFAQILSSAIQAEKDSIVFYLGMKEIVPEKSGKAKIDDIIKEEMSHIRIIAQKLAAIIR